jgi:creatinine amidohydrolase
MRTSSSRRLADLTSEEIAESITSTSVMIQPLGAIEQHGPHLPLSTDLIVAEAMSSALVDELGDELDLWLLPSLAYTKSNEHAWSPGTVWLGPETMLAVLRDVGRSLATLPARRLVFLNGHGGNTGLLDVALRELRLTHGLLTFLAHPFVPPDHGGESLASEAAGGIHGGAAETSMMLHLRPDLVRLDRLVSSVPNWLNEYEHLSFSGSVGFGWLSNDFGATGVIGDATAASAELGESLVNESLERLGAALAEVARFEFPGTTIEEGVS